MGILTNTTDFFGLDIGTSSIRVVQAKGGKLKTLIRYGSLDIEKNISKSDSNADLQKLGQAVKQVIAQSGITTPNVAVGIPSNKIFMTVVDIERLAPQELDKTIRLQADSLIPTPLSESKIDWAQLGDSPKESSKVEILLASVNNSFVEKRLDMLESLGLNVIAFEPDSLAITRSLLTPDSQEPLLILDIGTETTDLIIALNDAPRLIRSIPTGTDTIIKSAMQNLGIDEKQAQQFVFKFGLSQEKLEGQIYGAIIGTIEVLIAEIEKSIKFFDTRYTNTPLNKIVVTGGASTLPEFPLMIANKFGLSVEIGNSWRNISFPANMQNDLLKVSNKFSAAVGLAQRDEA
jgi:type IV pilus assembly protein PilM/plasmid segregation protein ParM